MYIYIYIFFINKFKYYFFFRKHHKMYADNRAVNKPTSNGLISNTSAHQFYQSQRPVNYYHTTVSSPRSHIQNYQNRRRYLSGKLFYAIYL